MKEGKKDKEDKRGQRMENKRDKGHTYKSISVMSSGPVDLCSLLLSYKKS